MQEMDYKNLGRAGLRISRVFLGNFNFFNVTSKDEAK